MPYRYIIDTHENLIRETWAERFDVSDLIASCSVEWADPNYRPGMALLSDFREAKGRLSADEVLKFASWFSNDLAPRRHAIVVRRERGFDFAGLFAMIRDSARPGDEQTRLFFSYAEAEAWVTGSRLVVTSEAEHAETEVGVRSAS